MTSKKKKHFPHALSMLLALIVMISLIFPAYATDSVDSLEQSASDLENELSGLNSDLDALNTEISSISKQIQEI